MCRYADEFRHNTVTENGRCQIHGGNFLLHHVNGGSYFAAVPGDFIPAISLKNKWPRDLRNLIQKDIKANKIFQRCRYYLMQGDGVGCGGVDQCLDEV